MQLRDAGKIHLDDTVATYLPWFQIRTANANDPAITIEQLVDQTAKQVGSPVTVVGFARFALGEGVEKETGDFAAEVAALTNA